MNAQYIKSMGTHRITLTRSEAETVAYSGTMYSVLLTALDTFNSSDEFVIYGSKCDVERTLRK